MEYSIIENLVMILRYLTSYALAGVFEDPKFEEKFTGEGPVVRDGYQSYQEDKKPYNSGDVRAG